MRKYILICLVFLCQISKAQIQDIAELANGKLIDFHYVNDADDKLYGYFILYDQGDSSEKTKIFEYVLLDKNLTKISSNSFDVNKRVIKCSTRIDNDGSLILGLELESESYRPLVLDADKRIDLKTNILTDYYGNCYKNNQIVTCEAQQNWRIERKKERSEKKEKGYNDKSTIETLKNGNYLVNYAKEYFDYVSDNSLIMYDKNKQKIWQFDYNKNATYKNNDELIKLDIDEKAFWGLIIEKRKNNYSFKYVAVDINTGKLLAENKISDLEEDFSERFLRSLEKRNYRKSFSDKIVFFIDFFSSEFKDFGGYFRVLIDKKDFSIKVNKINFKDNLKQFIPKLDRSGGVEGAYFLKEKDVFFFKDGSLSILTEKTKNGSYTSYRTTDIIIINFDKDFNAKNVNILDKEKSNGKYADYLFSQYISDGVVFFYRDYIKDDENKDKNWKLFINSIISKELKQESIIISSKQEAFSIFPFIAKEGYILLFEINKKEKYSQIRLEKLNY